MAIRAETKSKLLKFARQAIESSLGINSGKRINIIDPIVNEKRGVFVTLKKDGHLRGCVGLTEGIKPLADEVWEMAEEAAFHDPRFLPLTTSDLPDLKIEISVLTSPIKISDPQKIRLGVDGVIISKGMQKGLFLPQVAKETGWCLEEFMSHLCAEKAGLPVDSWKKGEANIEIFQVESFSEV